MRPRQSDMPVVPTSLDTIPSKLNETSGRPAAVLVGLTLQDNGWHVIMTERSAHLAHHAGQISFPGGKVEEGDHGLVATALARRRRRSPCRPTRSMSSADWGR